MTQQTTEEIVGNMALPTRATAISRIPTLSELQDETRKIRIHFVSQVRVISFIWAN